METENQVSATEKKAKGRDGGEGREINGERVIKLVWGVRKPELMRTVAADGEGGNGHTLSRPRQAENLCIRCGQFNLGPKLKMAEDCPFRLCYFFRQMGTKNYDENPVRIA